MRRYSSAHVVKSSTLINSFASLKVAVHRAILPILDLPPCRRAFRRELSCSAKIFTYGTTAEEGAGCLSCKMACRFYWCSAGCNGASSIGVARSRLAGDDIRRAMAATLGLRLLVGSGLYRAMRSLLFVSCAPAVLR